MKIIAVDPNPEKLMRLSAEIRKSTPPGSSVECFCDPLYAYQYSFYHPVDALYAVARMGRLTGLELAENMRSRYPALRVFILWHNDAFRQEAEQLEVDCRCAEKNDGGCGTMGQIILKKKGCFFEKKM